MNFIDKIVSTFNPIAGLKRNYARNILAASHTGASGSRNATKRWSTSAGNSDTDDLDDLDTLRPRSRDLYRNNPHGRGALRTSLTNVVGPGLKVQSRIDRVKLNLSEAEADAWEIKTERIFKEWAENIDCDAARKLNFYSLQGLAFLTTLMSGDSFGVLPRINRKNDIDLAIQILEADQCSTPFSKIGDNKIKSGVEVGKFGDPIAYHFSESHPGSDDFGEKYKWKRIPAFGNKTKLKNVIHLMEMERPGQKRGIPFLSPVIESLKQFGRYTEAELMAAVISGMFTAFIKTPGGDSMQLNSAEGQADTAPDVSLGNGAVVPLQEGEDITFADPARPNSNFGDFGLSVLRQIGAALDIPFEILAKQFNSSYSASRAALLEAWKFFKTKRTWLATYFCQPIYENFMYEAVAKGLIIAPGYFTSNSIRKAYNTAQWIGPAKGMIDEVKEVTAAAMRIQNNLSTYADETIQMNGTDFSENTAQHAKEKKMLDEAGLNTGFITSKQELNSLDDEDNKNNSE